MGGISFGNRFSWEIFGSVIYYMSYLKLILLIPMTVWLAFMLILHTDKCNFRRIYSIEHTSNVLGNPVETGGRMIATPPHYNDGWSTRPTGTRTQFYLSNTQMFPIIPHNPYDSGAILIDEDEFFLRTPLSKDIVKEMAQQLTDVATGKKTFVTMDPRNFEGFKNLPLNIARSIPLAYLQNFEKDPASYAAKAPSFFGILLKLYSGEWNKIHPFPNIVGCAKKLLPRAGMIEKGSEDLFWGNVEQIARSRGQTNACIRQGHPSMLAINRDGWKSWSLFSAINPVFFLYTIVFLTTSNTIRAEGEKGNKGVWTTGGVIWDIVCGLGVALLWLDNSYTIPNNNLALAIYTIVLTEWMRSLAESHDDQHELNIGWMKAKITPEKAEAMSLSGFFGSNLVQDSWTAIKKTIPKIFSMKDVPDLLDFTITGPILMVVTLSCASVSVDITSMQCMFVLDVATNTCFFMTKRNCWYYLKCSTSYTVPIIPFMMVTIMQIIGSIVLFLMTMSTYIELVFYKTVQGRAKPIEQWMAIIWLTGEVVRIVILTTSMFISVYMVSFQKQDKGFWEGRNNLAVSTITWVDILVKISISIMCVLGHINGGLMLQMWNQWGPE